VPLATPQLVDLEGDEVVGEAGRQTVDGSVPLATPRLVDLEGDKLAETPRLTVADMTAQAGENS